MELVLGKQCLFDVLQKGECLFTFILFIRHAKVGDPIPVCVMEEILVQLKSLHRVILDARHQFLCDCMEVTHVARVVCEHNALTFVDFAY